MKRGQVWWVDQADQQGVQPGFRCPVVIVQEDLLTDSRLATVMVAPITWNLRRALAVGNVELTPKQSGLTKAAVVLVCQVLTVDKSRLTALQGTLSAGIMSEVDRGLSLALGLNQPRVHVKC